MAIFTRTTALMALVTLCFSDVSFALRPQSAKDRFPVVQPAAESAEVAAVVSEEQVMSRPLINGTVDYQDVKTIMASPGVQNTLRRLEGVEIKADDARRELTAAIHAAGIQDAAAATVVIKELIAIIAERDAVLHPPVRGEGELLGNLRADMESRGMNPQPAIDAYMRLRPQLFTGPYDPAENVNIVLETATRRLDQYDTDPAETFGTIERLGLRGLGVPGSLIREIRRRLAAAPREPRAVMDEARARQLLESILISIADVMKGSATRSGAGLAYDIEEAQQALIDLIMNRINVEEATGRLKRVGVPSPEAWVLQVRNTGPVSMAAGPDEKKRAANITEPAALTEKDIPLKASLSAI